MLISISHFFQFLSRVLCQFCFHQSTASKKSQYAKRFDFAVVCFIFRRGCFYSWSVCNSKKWIRRRSWVIVKLKCMKIAARLLLQFVPTFSGKQLKPWSSPKNTHHKAKAIASCFPLSHPQPVSCLDQLLAKERAWYIANPLAVVELPLACCGSVFSLLFLLQLGDCFPLAVSFFPQW